MTDCGRARPFGEGRGDEYGNGYVSFVHASLTAVYPERKIRVINMGISGNTVRYPKFRWKTDVLKRYSKAPFEIPGPMREPMRMLT